MDWREDVGDSSVAFSLQYGTSYLLSPGLRPLFGPRPGFVASPRSASRSSGRAVGRGRRVVGLLIVVCARLIQYGSLAALAQVPLRIQSRAQAIVGSIGKGAKFANKLKLEQLSLRDRHPTIL